MKRVFYEKIAFYREDGFDDKTSLFGLSPFTLKMYALYFPMKSLSRQGKLEEILLAIVDYEHVCFTRQLKTQHLRGAQKIPRKIPRNGCGNPRYISILKTTRIMLTEIFKN